MHVCVYIYIYDGLPWWVSGKESACHCRIHTLIPGSGRSLREGKPLQYSSLRIPWTEKPGVLQVRGVAALDTT